MENIEKIFEFATVVSSLKTELRFKAAKNFEGDTVASHIWRLILLLVIISKELNLKIDILHAIKIALIHDLPEALVGDIDALLVFNNKELKIKKNKDEKIAIKKIIKILPENIGQEIYELWKDYDEKNSPEARLVYSLDKIEAIWTNLELETGQFDNNDLKATHINVGYKTYPELKDSKFLIEIDY
jgi:putative hydrolase of HD superfamily